MDSWDVIEKVKAVNQIGSKMTAPQKKFESVSPHLTLRLEYVKCGKINCKKCSRMDYHGPYLYAYWRERNNGN